MTAVVWTVAGSDSGGGAGIQADIKTFGAFRVHGCSVITALTAQNTRGVTRIALTEAEMVRAQVEALAGDMPPAAIKLGMPGSAEATAYLAERLPDLGAFLLCDPVMVATSGSRLASEESVRAMQRLFPHTDLLTPNLDEAGALLGRQVVAEDMERAAEELRAQTGVKAVLLKGGHAEGAFRQDYYTDGKERFWLTAPAIATRHTHGTGCTLSAAITALRASGYGIRDALVVAKAYVTQGLRLAPGLGGGHGPVGHAGWPETESDLPWLTSTAAEGVSRPVFPDCGERPLGFYPIVPDAEWLERILPLGVTTVQLRVKDRQGEALERQVAAAVACARHHGARLFVNDHWRLALKYGAYGVHLGQEDIETADVGALAAAGIRLGISTHCYAEVARALALRPSYIAIGPIFPTTTKEMPFTPQGLEALARWRRSLPSYPLVAIGGMFRHNAPDVLATGVEGIAAVRDVTHANDPEVSVREWLDLFTQGREAAHKAAATGETEFA